MPLFGWLPIVEKPILFTTLEDACYCGALFSTFALFDYTIGPLPTLVEYCYEHESGAHALNRYCGHVVEVIAFVVFISAFFYIIGIKKKQRKPILAFMFLLCLMNISLLIHSVLLLTVNIITNDSECDFPNVKSKDVVVYTSLKIISSLFFVTLYAYVLIVAKSFCLTFAKDEKKISKSKIKKDLEMNLPIRINDVDPSSSKR